ncbi:MAG: hypothetical protein K0S38_539, partial [Candidatus Paceibacter sp.]|nr:hypothetical protein [Candidatus Paceibacter sp.]
MSKRIFRWYTTRHISIFTMIETLEKIFGSAAKVKIMRLFLFNPVTVFDMDEI